MDLAIGAKDVFVMMTLFTEYGKPNLVRQCTYPLTGLACVSRVYTELGTFAVGPDGIRVIATYGVSVADLASRLDAPLKRVED
jgi:3-oxoadipate CoA-transferase, beta subunit